MSTGTYNPATAATSGLSSLTGGPSQDPVASAASNLPSYMDAPSITPQLWGLDSSTVNLPLYASSLPSTVKVSALKRNQVLGEIADKLGVKTKKGVSLEEQVTEALAKQYGVSTAPNPPSMDVDQATGQSAWSVTSKPSTKQSDKQVLSAVLEKAGLSKSSSVKSDAAAKALGISPALGSAKTAKANPDLNDPTTLGMLAKHLDVPSSKTNTTANQMTVTVQQAATQIYKMSQSQIAGLQAQLWEAGGFYDNDVEDPTGAAGPDASKLTPGNLDPYTIKAFGSFLTALAKSGKQVSWTDELATLSNKDAYGVPAGTNPSSLTLSQLVTSDTTLKPSQVATINQATSDQLLSTMRSNFESELGRAPTAAELAQFTAQYDQAQQANSKYLDPNSPVPTDYTDTGADLVPGVARPTVAASDFAESDTTEYGAHQMANAGALLLNAMRSPGGLGNEPNVTQAS